MKKITINYSADAPRTLAAAVAPFGSLAMTRQQAANLLASLGGQHTHVLPYLRLGMVDYPHNVAQDIITSCVPDVDYPHPARATAVVLDADGMMILPDDPAHIDGPPAAHGVQFDTPGGVTVTVTLDDVRVKFGRDSQFASASIIASVAMADKRAFTAAFLD